MVRLRRTGLDDFFFALTGFAGEFKYEISFFSFSHGHER